MNSYYVDVLQKYITTYTVHSSENYSKLLCEQADSEVELKKYLKQNCL